MENDNLKEEFTNVVLEYQNSMFLADDIERKYNACFGSLEVKRFKMTIDIIKLKKKISYIIAMKNNNLKIDEKEMERYAIDELEAENLFYEELVEKVKNSKMVYMISDEDERELKKIYYKIAKLIHPDLHPNYLEDEDLKSLWNKTLVYYEMGKLDELKLLLETVLVKTKDKDEININNIEEKILEYKKRIQKIRTTKPYILEKYLIDSYAVNDHKNELEKEISKLTEYKDALEEQIKFFLEGGDYCA